MRVVELEAGARLVYRAQHEVPARTTRFRGLDHRADGGIPEHVDVFLYHARKYATCVRDTRP